MECLENTCGIFRECSWIISGIVICCGIFVENLLSITYTLRATQYTTKLATLILRIDINIFQNLLDTFSKV